MNYPLVLLAAGVLALTACSKPGPEKPSEPVAPAPRGNLSESLGFASDADAFNRTQPPPPAAENPASREPVRRTLTATDGRKLDALLLSRTETTVKIRRQPDGAEFTIPLTNLSRADQTFVRQSSIPVTAGN